MDTMMSSTLASKITFCFPLLLITFYFSSSKAFSFGDKMPVVALNVKFVVKPDHREELLQLLRLDQIGTYTEPGALQFILGVSVNDPNTIHLHEQYTSSADLDFHVATPHFRTFDSFKQTRDPLVPDDSNSVIDIFHCSHTPEVKKPKPGAYCLNVESRIRPELVEEFLALMEQHADSSRAEPGCWQFDWGESPETPNAFYIHEEYAGLKGYQAHEATPHFARFMEFNKVKDPYSHPQVVSFYEAIE